MIDSKLLIQSVLWLQSQLWSDDCKKSSPSFILQKSGIEIVNAGGKSVTDNDNDGQ